MTAESAPEIANKPLLLDFLEWIDKGPRPYDEVMEAWRTSCPRFPIWEDAVELGFVVCRRLDGCSTVSATPRGRAFLRGAGR